MQEIELKKGDCLYNSSDGYPDQFGGPDGRKFMTKRFKQLLLDIHKKPMIDQKQILDKTIDEWRGDIEQIDDIIVIGVRI
jgi:serine phosphatase RsbU (regulator of sigma subunit)